MLRSALTSLALVVGHVLVMQAGQTPPAGQSTGIGPWYAAYASGDYQAIAGTLTHPEAWRALERSLLRQADAWKSEARERVRPVWTTTRVAFLAEVGSAVFHLDRDDADRDDAARVLAEARELVAMRPGLPGAEDGVIDAADRFEVAVHRTAVAILFEVPSAARAYLKAIEPRLSAFRRSDAGARLVARLDLATASLREAETRPFVRDASLINRPATRESLLADPRYSFPAVRSAPASVRQVNTEALRSALTAVLKAFPARNNLPEDVAVEVDVRRGFLHYRLGQYEVALSSINTGLAGAIEPAVRYWALLFSARVLEAVGRVDEAVQRYDEAVRAAWPRSQTAVIALSAAYFLKGDRAQAEAWARVARTLPSGSDPWWEYWYGDQRFGRALLTEIRSPLQ